jgi:N,N'-diacetyllegionaminate synthase
MSKLFECNPYVIAEVGSNWRSFADAKDSVSMAKKCGADAVKFQFFRESDLYGTEPSDDLKSNELPAEWLPLLKEKADACGIDFLCTAFSPLGLKLIDPLVGAHKVASAENRYDELLLAMGATNKPIIISCGGSGLGDILAIAKFCKEHIKQKVVFLYCNAAYPSRYHNLFNIDDLRKCLSGEGFHDIGFSDHSLDVIYAPLSAHRHFGARVIEKHFRLDHITNTPDAGHSLDTSEFSAMVTALRKLNTGVYGTIEEKPFYEKINRRMVATKKIPKGSLLIDRGQDKNYGFYRSLKPAPEALARIPVGARAANDIDALQPISRSCIVEPF